MTKKITDFEEYLINIHADQYFGLDDDMPDDYEDWLLNLGIQEIIDYAQDCINKIIKK